MGRLGSFKAAVVVLPVLCAGCEAINTNEMANTGALAETASRTENSSQPAQPSSENPAKEQRSPGHDLLRVAADIEARGDKNTAITLYERATNVPGANSSVRLELAAAYQRMQRYDDAMKVYQSIVETEPENGTAWLQMGSFLARRGKHDEALPAIAKAAPLLNSSRAYDRLGVTQTLAGRPDEAVLSLKKAQELAPEDLDIQTNLALAASLAGKKNAAVELMQEVVQQPKAQIHHKRNLILVLGLANKDSEALGLASAEISKTDIQVLLERARMINSAPTPKEKAKTLGTNL